MIKKILVTGSSGTIGTRLCETLLERGYSVVGVDVCPNNWSESVNSITIIADLKDRSSLDKLPAEVDIVIHLAANARVYNLVVDPQLARDNLEILFNILEHTRKNSIKRFFFASSREVYGNSEKHIHSEEDALVKNCESPYTASKIGGEALVHSYNQCYGIDFTILRFSNVYGMYDSSDRLIPLYIEKARAGEDLIVFGEEKLLDFTYIDDCVAGIILCIERFESAAGKTINLAYGQGTTIAEIARIVKDMMNSKSNIVIKDNRTGEVVKFVADISLAKNSICFSPEIDIREGIKRSIDWYDAHQSEVNR